VCVCVCVCVRPSAWSKLALSGRIFMTFDTGWATKIAHLPFALAFGCCINFCIYAMLRTRATFSWPILYLLLFENMSRKQVSLIPNMNKWYCTWRPVYISRWILLSMRNVTEGKNNTRLIYKKLFSKIDPFVSQSGKTVLSPAGYRGQYVACTLHADYLRLQTHTHNV